jgi:hypothetical protein
VGNISRQSTLHQRCATLECQLSSAQDQCKSPHAQTGRCRGKQNVPGFACQSRALRNDAQNMGQGDQAEHGTRCNNVSLHKIALRLSYCQPCPIVPKLN